jgi:ADP-ribose pyrophosphatase
MPLKPYDEVSQGAPDKRHVFTVRSDVVRSQSTGKQLTVDRLLAPDWVNVVAITTNQEIVLVRQWRFGTQAFTLELPAGLLERGEAPLAAGLRELLEETGYAPKGTPRIIGAVKPNPAFMGNTCTTVFAPDCERVAEQNLDANEEIEVVHLPVKDLDAAIERGELSTALGIVGLFWWRRLGMGSP